jgi:hypothetical protein
VLKSFLNYCDRLCAYDHCRVPLPWFAWSGRRDPASLLRRRILALERGATLQRVGVAGGLLAVLLHWLRGPREIVLCWRRRSRGCAVGFGVSRWRQLATLGFIVFRYNFPPSLYYRARLFRLPRERWLKVFSHDEAVTLAPVMEQRTGMFALWTKRGWQQFCAQHDLPGVATVAEISAGRLVVRDAAAWGRGDDLFLKPDDGWASRGTVMLEWQADPAGWQASGARTGFVARAALNQFASETAAGGDYVGQTRLRNHPDLADLAQRALINFRVLTLRELDGTISVFSAALRIPGHAEHCSDVPAGFFVPVDLKTGVMGFAEGLDMALGPLSVHPITGVPIQGRPVAQWPEMRDLARAAHVRMPPSVPCVGWDLVCTDGGVKLLEANIAWSGNLTQLRGLAPLGESSWPAIMLAYLDEVPPDALLAEAEAGRRRAAQSARTLRGTG